MKIKSLFMRKSFKLLYNVRIKNSLKPFYFKTGKVNTPLELQFNLDQSHLNFNFGIKYEFNNSHISELQHIILHYYFPPDCLIYRYIERTV